MFDFGFGGSGLFRFLFRSFRLFRWFRSGCSGGFVPVVPGFSTCRQFWGGNQGYSTSYFSESFIYNKLCLLPFCARSLHFTSLKTVIKHVSKDIIAPFTVDAMEVLIKYCTNSFPQVDQFI